MDLVRVRITARFHVGLPPVEWSLLVSRLSLRVAHARGDGLLNESCMVYTPPTNDCTAGWRAYRLLPVIRYTCQGTPGPLTADPRGLSTRATSSATPWRATVSVLSTHTSHGEGDDLDQPDAMAGDTPEPAHHLHTAASTSA